MRRRSVGKINLPEYNIRVLNDNEIKNTLNRLRPSKDIELARRLLLRVKVLIDKQCWIINDDWSYYSTFEKLQANRLSYELFIGKLIFDSLHKCDRRGCINPDHLYQGKDRQNKNDWVGARKARATERREAFLSAHDLGLEYI